MHVDINRSKYVQYIVLEWAQGGELFDFFLRKGT